MYAVIKTGGKQYRVESGRFLKIEKIVAEEGATVEFDQVLLVSSDAGIKVGKPYLEGGKVTATVMNHGRHDKIRILKFRRRKHHMKRAGHRQHYTQVMINDISAN
ncbi:MAG: 50S ribosomal protein L21 [Methylococcaceae bacterium]|nr:MAG: 50S ribosomal protein L21 [Methylococcaceae bacterium]